MKMKNEVGAVFISLLEKLGWVKVSKRVLGFSNVTLWCSCFYSNNQQSFITPKLCVSMLLLIRWMNGKNVYWVKILNIKRGISGAWRWSVSVWFHKDEILMLTSRKTCRVSPWSDPCWLCCYVFKYRKCEGWSAAPGQEVERLELGLCARGVDSYRPTLPVFDMWNFLRFRSIKTGPSWAPVPFPWRLFLPRLVLSSAFCCLDLRLQSWYKYCTFSWTRYRLETRTSKTEIKKKKGVGHILNIEAWPKVSFDAAMSLRLPSTCPLDVENNCSLRQIARHRHFCCRQSVVCLCAATPDVWKLWKEFHPWFRPKFHKRLQLELQSHFPLTV